MNEATVIAVDNNWKIDHASEDLKNIEILLEESYA